MSNIDVKQNSICGWTKLYHQRGPQVTLPVMLGTPAEMFAAVGAYLDAGFLVVAPGLEEGEEREHVAYVVHGEHERDGQTTPFLLLYAANEAMKFSFLKVYLNKPADIAAFEFASGLKLNSIPVYIGQDKPERGKSKQVDRYVIAAPAAFEVVFKQNPRWSETDAAAHQSRGEMYAVPRRVFVRWGKQMPEVNGEVPKQNDDAAPKSRAKMPVDGPDLIKRLNDAQAKQVAAGKCQPGALWDALEVESANEGHTEAWDSCGLEQIKFAVAFASTWVRAMEKMGPVGAKS